MKAISFPQKMVKYKYVFAAVALGVLLMLLPGEKKAESEAVPRGDPFDRLAVQSEMEEVLGAVDGAGKLRLLLSVESGTELELASNISEEREEGSAARETQVLTLDAGSSEEVVVTKSRYPRFTGALIVCEGAGSASVRLALTQAVSSLTGLTADKIAVIKGKP